MSTMTISWWDKTKPNHCSSYSSGFCFCHLFLQMYDDLYSKFCLSARSYRRIAGSSIVRRDCYQDVLFLSCISKKWIIIKGQNQNFSLPVFPLVFHYWTWNQVYLTILSYSPILGKILISCVFYHRLPFAQSSKHVVDLFGHVMRRQVGSYNPAAQYLLANPSILVSLLQGYSKPDRAIHYGAVSCRHTHTIANLLKRSSRKFPFIQKKKIIVSTLLNAITC